MIEKDLKKTIAKYKLIDKKDKVLVACSGGKDSTTLLYLLHKLYPKQVSAITIDASIGKHTQQNLENLKKFCKKHKIKLHEYSFRKEFNASLPFIYKKLKTKNIKLLPCAICGVLRRYLLNKYAYKLKATKIATGHNLDDEAQSILMNFLRNYPEQLARLGPVTGLLRHKKFVIRIKPLYFISEKEIEKYSKKMNFPVKYTACPMRQEAYRNHVAKLLDKYEKKHKNVKMNIINYYLKHQKFYKKHFMTKEKLRNCKICKEPTNKEVCMTCELLTKIHKL